MTAPESCPFCLPETNRLLVETETCRILWDNYPVSPGHALIVPKAHIADWFTAPAALQAELATLIETAKAAIEKHHPPHGPLQVHTTQLGAKFIEYYWRQARPFGVREASDVLLQNAGQQAAVMNKQ